MHNYLNRNEKNIMANITIKLGIVCIILASILILPCDAEINRIDAYITIPDYTPPIEWCEPTQTAEVDSPYQRDALDDLQDFIANDTGDQKQYISGVYVCMDFSIDLANNLTAAGYDAGVVLQSARSGRGHMLVWVTMPPPYNLLYVEPIYDNIYNPADYINATDNENYIFREISIESAERNRADQRRWS